MCVCVCVNVRERERGCGCVSACDLERVCVHKGSVNERLEVEMVVPGNRKRSC